MKNHGLTNAEWNFKDCPENELRLCLYYELAREIESWQQMISKRCKGLRLDDDSYDIYAEDSLSLMPPFEFAYTYPHLAPLADWDEWPKVPWLELNPQKRRDRANNPQLTELTDAWALFTDAWPLMKGANPDCFVTKEEGGKKVSYTALKIDWNKPDSQLIREFSAWLDLRRKQIEVVAREKRGSTSYRDVLKRLGAYRLLKAMKWEDAADLTQDILGKPLYSDQTAWSRAKSQARKSIEAFEKGKSLDSVIG